MRDIACVCAFARERRHSAVLIGSVVKSDGSGGGSDLVAEVNTGGLLCCQHCLSGVLGGGGETEHT